MLLFAIVVLTAVCGFIIGWYVSKTVMQIADEDFEADGNVIRPEQFKKTTHKCSVFIRERCRDCGKKYAQSG